MTKKKHLSLVLPNSLPNPIAHLDQYQQILYAHLERTAMSFDQAARDLRQGKFDSWECAQLVGMCFTTLGMVGLSINEIEEAAIAFEKVRAVPDTQANEEALKSSLNAFYKDMQTRLEKSWEVTEI